MNKNQQFSTVDNGRQAAKFKAAAKSPRAVEILVRTDGVVIDPELHAAVLQKIGRARQYAPQAMRARVQLRKVCAKGSADQFRAHVLYEVRGNDVSAEQTAHDPVVALDLVAKKIKRRLRRRKTATLARRVRGHRAAPRQKAMSQV